LTYNTNQTAYGVTNAAEIYTPATISSTAPMTLNAAQALTGDSFATTGSLNTSRVYHTATVIPPVGTILTQGAVVIAGGMSNSGALQNSIEVYNPATGTFTSAGSLLQPRIFASASLLVDGLGSSTCTYAGTGSAKTPTAGLACYKVLISGGVIVNGSTLTPVTSSEIVTITATGTASSPVITATSVMAADMKYQRESGATVVLPVINNSTGESVMALGGTTSASATEEEFSTATGVTPPACTGLSIVATGTAAAPIFTATWAGAYDANDSYVWYFDTAATGVTVTNISGTTFQLANADVAGTVYVTAINPQGIPCTATLTTSVQ
jgi:hypothetical protein